MSWLRIALALVGFFGVIFLSPFLVLACVVVLSLRYRAWEALFIGLFMDLVWLPPGSMFQMIPFATLLAIFIVWALEPLRSELLTR